MKKRGAQKKNQNASKREKGGYKSPTPRGVQFLGCDWRPGIEEEIAAALKQEAAHHSTLKAFLRAMWGAYNREKKL